MCLTGSALACEVGINPTSMSRTFSSTIFFDMHDKNLSASTCTAASDLAASRPAPKSLRLSASREGCLHELCLAKQPLEQGSTTSLLLFRTVAIPTHPQP